MGDFLPRKTENMVYRYLIAISKLRLGILTEQREDTKELSKNFLLQVKKTEGSQPQGAEPREAPECGK